jgi:hypothetical protein
MRIHLGSFRLRSLAIIIFAALAVLCVSDVVQAALAPVASADCAMCNEQTGCGAPAIPHLALPAAIPPGSASMAAPTVLVVLAGALAFAVHTVRPVVPLAPRSPPAA